MSVIDKSDTASDRAVLQRLLLKQAVPMAMIVLFGALLIHALRDVDLRAVLAQVQAIQPHQWLLATIGMGLSFATMARMELVVHRILGTGAGPKRAQIAGLTAIATAQVVGFGLLTATLVRWRMLRGTTTVSGLLTAAQVTALVSLSFMIALGVISAVMLLLLGAQIAPDLPWPRIVGFAILAGVALLVGMSLWRPRWLLRIYLPPLRAQASLLGLTLLDTLAAAMVLYALFPIGALPPPALFYGAFLLALGLGLIGTTPGGVGPFEFTLLAFLPMVPEPTVLAAIMGYRIVYFAVPGALAALCLILGPRLAARLIPAQDSARASVRPIGGGPKSVTADAISFLAPRAEAGLIRQGEFDLLTSAEGLALAPVAPTGQSLIALARPLLHGMQADLALRSLSEAAEDRMLIPCLYKCDARIAVAARALGWQVVKVSDEAVLTPADYDVTVPARRQLRRLLRKAEAAGVQITEAGPHPPLAEMRALAEAWAAGRAGARGFSMGLFEDTYVQAQRIYLAHCDGALVGFVSFHEAWAERTLDLMCTAEATPPGTTQALLHAAIEAAKADNVPRLSLAAVPCLAETLPLPLSLSDRVRKAVAAEGLRRFKASFAPRWEPLYLVAPNRIGLLITSVDLVDRIVRPRAGLRPKSRAGPRFAPRSAS